MGVVRAFHSYLKCIWCCCFLLGIVQSHSEEAIERDRWTQRLNAMTGEKFAQGRAEIVFLLDRSGSVGSANFEVQKGFVESLLTQVVVAPNASRVAVISYSASAVRHIDFLKNPGTKCTLAQELLDVEYQDSGKTNIAAALLEAHEVLRKARPGVNKVVILISDGLSNHGGNPVEVAKKLKAGGVEIFTFGIGRMLRGELQSIASSLQHSFDCSGFREFRLLARRIRGDPHESAWAADIGKDKCEDLCDNPYRGTKHDPGCCDHVAKCTCSLLSGRHTCVCGPGYYGLSGLMGECTACPIGTYKANYEPTAMCTQCPTHSSTANEASAFLKDCKCKTGFTGDLSKGESCKPVQCAPLQAPANGFIPNGQCDSGYDGSCFFACNEGYELEDSASQERVCQASGEWTGRTAVCRKLQCAELSSPPNGHVRCSSDSNTVGTRCQFYCDPGHFLVGSKVVTCLQNQRWSGNSRCESVTCPALGVLRHGIVLRCSPNERQKFNAVCLLSCDSGFQLVGPNITICNENGQWNDATQHSTLARQPTCKDVEQPKLKCPEPIKVVAKKGKNYAQLQWYRVSASDNSGIAPTITWTPASLQPLAQFPIGKTVIGFKAVDQAGLTSFCETVIEVKDKERPKVLSCPSDVTVNTTELDIPVHWKEPEFWDNSGTKLQIDKTDSPGDDFSPGRHRVEYLVKDSSGNQAICTFNIVVNKHHCPFHPAPTNGALACDDWLYGQFCRVYCNKRFDFTTTPAEWYICDRSTQWQTVPPGLTVPWPDCAEWYEPTAVRRAVVGQYYTGDCHNPKVQEAIKASFLAQFRQRFDETEYCAWEGSCTVDMVRLRCGASIFAGAFANRVRRDLQPYHHPDTEIEASIIVSSQGTAPGVEKLLRTIDLVVQPSENNMEQNLLENFDNLTVAAVAVTVGEPHLVCGIGAVLKEEECVKCTAGTFHHRETDSCQPCPVGMYQDTEGQMVCLKCPSGTTTTSTQSRNQTDCRGICSPGSFSDSGLETCEACPIGTFQDASRQTACKPCPSFTTTGGPGATSMADCAEYCPPGRFSPTGLFPCEACSIGWFQPNAGQSYCSECPTNLTTVAFGSSKLEDCIGYNHCMQESCQNGGTCMSARHGYTCECAMGFSGYNCEQNIDDCLSQPCINNGTCVDRVVGFECICAMGYTGKICNEEINECLTEPCNNGGTCLDLVGEYKCLCPPAFAGDECDDEVAYCEVQPCYNGGTCQELETARVCLCMPGWTGEDCSVNIDDCAGAICQNGASCIDKLNDYSCKCLSGFVGYYCEQNADDCMNNACQNGATCQDQINHYTCTCPPGYSGQFCEVVMSHNFIMVLNQAKNADFAAKRDLPTLTSATVSMWVQTSDQLRAGTPLSYAVQQGETTVDNALTFTDCGSLKIYVNNQPVYTDLQLNDGNWHHIAFTWASNEGLWQLYHNCVLKDTDIGMQAGRVISGGGMLVVGQEQDSVGGDFSAQEMFVGNISRVNIWNRILISNEIEQLCRFVDSNKLGVVASWPDFTAEMTSEVHILPETRPLA